MYRTTFVILILTFTKICFGQTTQTKYFNNQWLEKEVLVEKAKFLETITKNEDGSVTTEVKNIKKNEIVRSETYKGDEPYGVWVYQSGKETTKLDYNFQLKYANEKCTDSISSVKISNYFQDNDSLGYKAPKISSGESNIYQYIIHNINFPPRAREEGIQGKVYVVFTFNKDGSTDNFYIEKGTNILLDKEAVRILKQLKFSSPPTLQGQPQNFCVTMPISFKLM